MFGVAVAVLTFTAIMLLSMAAVHWRQAAPAILGVLWGAAVMWALITVVTQ